jgi:hypothetical protein
MFGGNSVFTVHMAVTKPERALLFSLRMPLDPPISTLKIRSSYFLSSYPLVYWGLGLPISVERWIEYRQETVHNTAVATFTASAIYDLSGAANVLLFFITRPDLSLFRRDEPNEGQLPNHELENI